MITNSNWILSDADFAAYAAAFKFDTCETSELYDMLIGDDETIDSVVRNREGFWEEALEGLIKKRNACARFLKVPERRMDPSWIAPLAKPFSIALQGKELIPLMRKPTRPMTAVVVDDLQIVAIMFNMVTKHWPDLAVTYITQQGGVPVVIPLETDLIILDEHLIGTTGTKIFQEQRTFGSPAIFGSISNSGNCPAFTIHHYNLKVMISSSREAAEALVKFINDMIAAAESRPV